MNEPKIHKSVMVGEVISALHIKKGGLYIDGTLGTGGHTLAILAAGGSVLGIDMDPEMVKIAEERISAEYGGNNYKLTIGSFIDLDKIAYQNGWNKVDGIVLDLGVSNLHLKDEKRGFSFANPEALLDMRLNPLNQGVKASDLLNVLREDQIREMFEITLTPSQSRWLTKRVVEFRKHTPVSTSGDFLEICKGLKTGKSGLSEATLPFLALRIAVNSELDNLRSVLPKAYNLLQKDGWLAVITFHSGEDILVKKFVKELGVDSQLATFLPSEAEIYDNPRARSAKVRAIQK